jgi:hypothetical protein
VVTSQKEKLRVVFEHFNNHIWSCPPRKHHINFAGIRWQPQQLMHLDLPFTEQEVASTIKSLHAEKSPGPDGFIGLFFKTCWEIIKVDLMAAVNQFYNLNQ